MKTNSEKNNILRQIVSEILTVIYPVSFTFPGPVWAFSAAGPQKMVSMDTGS